ncbi:MAG: 2-oxo acid dehydrogenase subunit E2 [Verrucomicrobia bacterium]|nr:2-oxo acid dehydrogenase subunit E2 [Verrucomicrobiota bacterium]NDF16624.1 2-oxo acid dehydrogenase subunit E2 [Verrucomicrobiota bacterium]
MGLVAISMPQLGESIAEATLIRLKVRPGDKVKADQEVAEVETSKAVMSVTTSYGGVWKEWRAKEGKSYPVGYVLGHVDAVGAVAPETAPKAAEAAAGKKPAKAMPAKKTKAAAMAEGVNGANGNGGGVLPTITGLPVPAKAAGASYLSPRMKARINELGLHAADLAGLAPSGAKGRVTIEDFERFIAELEKQKLTPASSMRVAVADAMRRSWTRPLATVGRGARMDAVMAHRRQHPGKPGPTLYAARALGIALGENSVPAGRLVGNRIVHPSSIDIGFAVEAEDGVLVPVLRKVNQTPLDRMLPVYGQLMNQAKERKLPADAVGGSVAVVTNYGTFGLEWATPIPLPEQSLVLGLGAAKKVPAWDDASQSFRPVNEARLTLSFDHRVIDGGAAGRLLARVAELLESPELL